MDITEQTASEPSPAPSHFRWRRLVQYRLRTLFALTFSHTQVTDAGLEHIKGLNGLQDLSELPNRPLTARLRVSAIKLARSIVAYIPTALSRLNLEIERTGASPR